MGNYEYMKVKKYLDITEFSLNINYLKYITFLMKML